MTDKEIEDCDGNKDNWGVDIDLHFESKLDSFKSVIDVGREGSRMYSLMVGVDVDEDSVLSALFTSVSLAASEMAARTLSKIIGLPADALLEVLSEFECRPGHSINIGWDGIRSIVESHHRGGMPKLSFKANGTMEDDR